MMATRSPLAHPPRRPAAPPAGGLHGGRCGEGGLVQHEPSIPRVSWSPEAICELELTVKDRSVQEDLKRNAEETLHQIQERSDVDRGEHGEHSADAGRVGEIMWHRGWTHEQERQAERELEESTDDGPWNYFLIYRQVPGSAAFEVLAVRSVHQVANCWRRMGDEDGGH